MNEKEEKNMDEEGGDEAEKESYEKCLYSSILVRFFHFLFNTKIHTHTQISLLVVLWAD